MLVNRGRLFSERHIMDWNKIKPTTILEGVAINRKGCMSIPLSLTDTVFTACLSSVYSKEGRKLKTQWQWSRKSKKKLDK